MDGNVTWLCLAMGVGFDQCLWYLLTSSSRPFGTGKTFSLAVAIIDSTFVVAVVKAFRKEIEQLLQSGVLTEVELHSGLSRWEEVNTQALLAAQNCAVDAVEDAIMEGTNEYWRIPPSLIARVGSGKCGTVSVVSRPTHASALVMGKNKRPLIVSATLGSAHHRQFVDFKPTTAIVDEAGRVSMMESAVMGRLGHLKTAVFAGGQQLRDCAKYIVTDP